MKHMIRKTVVLLLTLAMLLSGFACTSTTPAATPTATEAPATTVAPTATEAPVTEPTAEPAPSDDEIDGELILDHEEELQYADKFAMTRYKGGYTMFTVAAVEDRQFLIVPENKSVPAALSANTVVLQQPINKVCMCTTGMVSVVDAIGGLDSVVAVGTDIDGWYLDSVIEKMNAGEIAFTGSYKEPDFEALIAKGIQLEIDTTMLSKNPDIMAKYDELGIPYFIEASSKEGHPLARIEWVKLFGAILGLEAEATTYFDAQVEKLNAVTAVEKCGKTVAMFYLSSSANLAYARNGGDYMAKMIDLAGGTYIMADVDPDKNGNAKINFEELYSRCKDADYIFYINFFAEVFESVDEMIACNELFSDFKAVKDGNVYVTAPHYTQDTASIADIIADMHTVLNDSTVDTTGSLTKLH